MTEVAAPTPERSDRTEKALRKIEEARGLLDPGDRYRALVNAVEQTQDLIEMGDRKARFALVILSVLNAFVVLVVTRGLAAWLPTEGPWSVALMLQVAVYAVMTLYFVWQAVAALRPRGVRPPPRAEMPHEIAPGRSMRVLFHADVVARDRGEYLEVWERLRMDNLNTELADQLYALSVVSQRKYAALDRLYSGVNVMTLLLGLMIATVVFYQVTL